MRAHGLSPTQTIEGVGDMTMLAAARLLDAAAGWRTSPSAGSDGSAILASLGLDTRAAITT